MKNKVRVAILFGGKSAEHEVSLISARNVFEALDKKKYDVVGIGIDKAGRWHWDAGCQLLRGRTQTRVEPSRHSASTAVMPGTTAHPLVQSAGRRRLGSVDVVFPVLHGPFGEDGTVQGLLKLANLPFVGAGVLGSAVGMDKDVMKRLLRDAGVPIAKFLVLGHGSHYDDDFHMAKGILGLPFFVKPANLGSSVGISKVSHRSDFRRALREALRYDNKIILEETILGREIECSVLGNDNPIASLPGEIVTRHAFYSYDAKYIDEKGARLLIPARLPKRIVKRVQELAVKTFKVLCCDGMARVDFFVRPRGAVLVNEINTIPGFTKISMYPKLWEASGIPYSKLLDRLIALAREKFREEKKLKTSL